MKTKTAYISGPMTGLVNCNFEKFKEAQLKLEKQGYIVDNPHEIGKDIYEKWSKIIGDITEKQKKEMWDEFMKVDLQYVVKADCVFVLDNWESSNGATLELLVAQKLSIPIYYIRDMSPFNVTFQISKFDRIPI